MNNINILPYLFIKQSTRLEIAALIDCQLTVARAIRMAASPIGKSDEASISFSFQKCQNQKAKSSEMQNRPDSM